MTDEMVTLVDVERLNKRLEQSRQQNSSLRKDKRKLKARVRKLEIEVAKIRELLETWCGGK